MPDHLQKLEEIKKLKDEGVLTPEEFEKEKAKILKEGDAPTPTQTTQVIVNQKSGGCLKAALIIGAILFILYLIGMATKQ